jgi:hypothetical protein
MCENKHEGHTKAFFKDQYIYTCNNYDNVEQISQQDLQKLGQAQDSFAKK